MWKSQFDDRALKSYLLCFNISRFWICTYTECSNCNAKDLRINKLESQKQVLETRVRMLEARLEMARNPDDHDHVCQSDAILRELLSDMENLCSCLIKFYSYTRLLVGRTKTKIFIHQSTFWICNVTRML